MNSNNTKPKPCFSLKNFPDLLWALHYEVSRQFMASVFGMAQVVRVDGNIEQQ